MESVNVTEEAVGFPSIEPTAVVDDRIYRIFMDASSPTSIAGRGLMSKHKRLARECLEFYGEYRLWVQFCRGVDRDLAERRRVLAEEAVDEAARVKMAKSLIKVEEFSRVLAEEVVNEAADVERAKSLIEKVRASQFIEEASIAKVNAALSEGLFKFFEALAEAIAAEMLVCLHTRMCRIC